MLLVSSLRMLCLVLAHQTGGWGCEWDFKLHFLFGRIISHTSERMPIHCCWVGSGFVRVSLVWVPGPHLGVLSLPSPLCPGCVCSRAPSLVSVWFGLESCSPGVPFPPTSNHWGLYAHPKGGSYVPLTVSFPFSSVCFLIFLWDVAVLHMGNFIPVLLLQRFGDFPCCALSICLSPF